MDFQKIKATAALVFTSTLVVLVLAFLFFHFAGPIPLSVTQTTVEKTATFDVSAEAKVTAIPDTAEVDLGIQVNKSTVQEGQQEANEKINKITEELKGLGIQKELIKTIRYHVYPNYDYQTGQKITGYNINITLRIKVKDFSQINQVIDAATNLGANQIGQLNFTIDDSRLEELKMEARKQAIEKAKDKAREIAKSGDLKLGRIVNISENAISPFSSIYRERAVGGVGETSETTQIEPGQAEIVILVTLSYETL